MHTVRVVDTEEDRKACYDIRFQVFVDGQGVPAELELDEFEDVCAHFIATDNGIPTGTGRVREVDELYVKFERVRTHRISVEERHLA